MILGMSSLSDSCIYVAGHRGMVGSAVVRALRARGHERLLTAGREEVDLREQSAVRAFLERERPEIVVLAAARVGGIVANASRPAEFLYDNLMVAANVIDAAWHCGVKRLLFLGSSCIYPREAPQPMPESCLLSGPLEVTNEAYALAKIAGLKLCQHYRAQHGALFHSAMPTNLYGPGDNYHPEESHVIPGLLRRFHEARQRGDAEVVVWGSGRPLREFLHVDDLAAACLHLLELEAPPDWVNVGSGEECSIAELAATIREVVGYRGVLRFDASRPDGTPRKRLDTTCLERLGWRPRIRLKEGLREAYQDFLTHGTRLG